MPLLSSPSAVAAAEASAQPEPNAANTTVDPKLNRLVAAQLCKTKMCAMFARGSCTDPTCRFAHSELELRSPPDLTKTAICRAFQRGHCREFACKFAHGEQELRVTPSVYKTQICHFFERGHCKKGSRCRHAHGTAELRAFEGPEPLAEAADDAAVPKELTTAPASPGSEPWASTPTGPRRAATPPGWAGVSPPERTPPPLPCRWAGASPAALSGSKRVPKQQRARGRRLVGEMGVPAPPLPLGCVTSCGTVQVAGTPVATDLEVPWQKQVLEPMKVCLPGLDNWGLAGGGLFFTADQVVSAAAAAAYVAREHSEKASAAYAMAAKFAAAAYEDSVGAARAAAVAAAGHSADTDSTFELVRSLRCRGLGRRRPAGLVAGVGPQERALAAATFGGLSAGKGSVPSTPTLGAGQLPGTPLTPRAMRYLDGPGARWHPAVGAARSMSSLVV